MMSCRQCGMVFTSPQPDQKLLETIYSNDGYYAYLPFSQPLIPVRENAWNKIKAWAKNVVVDNYYGYGFRRNDFKPSGFLRLAGRLMKDLPRDNVVALRRMVHFNGGGRHLDIGSGSGFYVWWMGEHGWQSEGIELNYNAVENGRRAGVKIKKVQLLDSHYPDSCFDLVTAWGVIEHLLRIKECFREIARIVKPGGRFVGFVPNIGSWDAEIFKDQWQGLEIPSHLYHFTPETLERLLAEAGLKLTGIEYLPALNSWKASLDKIGITSGFKRKALESAGRLMYLVSNRVGRGAMFRFDSVKT